MDKIMARADAPGSREPSPDGLGPSGFDPSRVRLSANEAQALRALGEADGDCCYCNFRWIAERSGLPRHLVRRTVRALARKGLAQFAKGLWTEDGEPFGAGYALTKQGRDLCSN